MYIMFMDLRDFKPEPRSENEPKFDLKNKADRRLAIVFSIIAIIFAIIVIACFLIYYLLFN